MTSTPRRLRSAAAVAAVTALALAPVSAHAAGVKKPKPPPTPPPPLNITYDAVGSTHIAKPNSDVALGPTQLQAAVSSVDGSFTGHLPLPQTRAAFKVIGLLPATAKVDFIEAAPVTGKLQSDPTRTFVTSTASYYIKLSDVTLGGLPTFVGNKCQTTDPITVPANTPEGESFNLTTGGHLTGTYSIGKFANCGLTTGIINLLVPGSGNTLDLNLSNGRIG